VKYGQFCPIAKSAEILGDRWTLLIVREILMGASRFNEMRRGLGTISTAVLTERLKTLVEQGMVVRRKLSGKTGYEYFPTPACQELLPILVSLGDWGMRWAKDNLVDEDYDVELLMLYLERSIDHERLPGPETVLQFEFSDLRDVRFWWLIVGRDKVDVCVKDPGRDIDVWFKSTVRTMSEVWLGNRSWREAIGTGELSLIGDAALTKTVNRWLRPSVFAPDALALG
tara:strand:- start:184 stop:864 length:681 start_codon:yes stop_codon:yes gene_type:complete